MLVGRDDAVADGAQRDLRAFLLAEQRLFVQLALGDIVLDAGEPAQPPGFVQECLGAADDPEPFAVTTQHAVRALENFALAGDVIADELGDTRAVIRMDKLVPVDAVGQFVVVVAEHGAPARRKPSAVGRGVIVPKAVIGAALPQRFPLTDVGELAVESKAAESRTEAGRQQLDGKVHVDRETDAGPGSGEGEEPLGAAPDAEADQDHGTDAGPRERRAFGSEGATGIAGIADFEAARMAQPCDETGQVCERRTAQGRGFAGAEHGLGGIDALDRCAGAVVGGKECRVALRLGAQDLEVLQ